MIDSLRERDISWLYFNERVLQEAGDSKVPLYERIKFLAIYSSNLDEFFRVRVSSMRRFKELKKETRKELLDIKPKRILKQVQKIVQSQLEEFGRIFREEILPDLESEGFELRVFDEFSEGQKAFTKAYFQERLSDHVKSVLVDNESRPWLDNQGLYFAVLAQDQIYIVNIPTSFSERFIVLPGDEQKFAVTVLDEIVRQNIPGLIGREPEEIIAIKISRDAELYIDDEYSGNLLEKLKASLRQRDIGAPTRFLYDASISDDFLEKLREAFDLTKYDLTPGARHHNFDDLFSFPDKYRKTRFYYPEEPPLEHPELERKESLIDSVIQKDRIVHYPYQPISYLLRFLEEVAEHPDVEEISMTLYRAANKSKIAASLLKAASKGKKVTVFIEAKARFNEESNLNYGDELTKAGARVLYSYPGIKVHAKLLSVTFKTSATVSRLCYLSTGNFNEKTARIYCDHGFFTANQKICSDVNQVFDVLDGKVIIPKSNHLLIAPFTLRRRFVELIDREIELAKSGQSAYMILKMNSLEDPEMIQKLYDASAAGVKIKLIVRGISCIKMGVLGLSDNIEGLSIVDRYLEHARLYIFGNGGEEQMLFVFGRLDDKKFGP